MRVAASGHDHCLRGPDRWPDRDPCSWPRSSRPPRHGASSTPTGSDFARRVHDLVPRLSVPEWSPPTSPPSTTRVRWSSSLPTPSPAAPIAVPRRRSSRRDEQRDGSTAARQRCRARKRQPASTSAELDPRSRSAVFERPQSRRPRASARPPHTPRGRPRSPRDHRLPVVVEQRHQVRRRRPRHRRLQLLDVDKLRRSASASLSPTRTRRRAHRAPPVSPPRGAAARRRASGALRSGRWMACSGHRRRPGSPGRPSGAARLAAGQPAARRRRDEAALRP